MSGGTEDMRDTAAHFTATVLESNWQVALATLAGGTVFAVTQRSNPEIPPNVGASRTFRYIGADIIFRSGDSEGFSSTIKALVSSGGVTEITLNDPLPAALAAGDVFTIYVIPGLSQVGGTAQTGADWTPLIQDQAGATGASGTATPARTVLVGGTDGTDVWPLSVVRNNDTLIPANAPVLLIAGQSGGYAEILGVVPVPIGADAIPTDAYFGPFTSASLFGYNGTTWDRVRSIPGTTGVLATPYSGMQNTAITASAEVKASAGVVGTLINTGSATSPVITVYDNTAANGTVIWAGTLTAGQVLPLGIPCGTGIYVSLAAAGTITVSYA